MKTFFAKRECPRCGCRHDPAYLSCPKCGAQTDDPDALSIFKKQIPVPWWKNLIFFLTGLIGLSILATIISIIVELSFVAGHPGATTDDLIQYLSSVDANFAVSGTAYLLLTVALSLVLWKSWKHIGKSFASWVPFVAAIIGYVCIYGFNLFYNLIMELCYQAAGRPLPGVNANESALRAMALAYPALALIVFGLLGPLCEEITYRIGLFGFLSRFGRVLAYILTAVVFGFIHFAWGSLFSPSYPGQALDELANLPPYIFAGLVFGFLYDRFGFAASFTAHFTNNLISLIVTIALPGQ